MSIAQHIEGTLGELAKITTILEEAKAKTPLYDQVGKIYDFATDKVLPAIVITFDSDSRHYFINAFLPKFPPELNCSSLKINCGRNRIANASHSKNFSSHQELITHLSENYQSLKAITQLEIEVDQLEGLAANFFKFADLSKLLELDLIEFNRLVDKTNVAVVAAAINYKLSPENRATLLQILKQVDYLQICALPKIPLDPSGPYWHQEPVPSQLKALPPCKLDFTDRPKLFESADSPIRGQVIQSNLFNQFTHTASLVQAQVEAKLHYLDCCEAADDFTLTLIENDPNLTANIENNREALDLLSDTLERFNKQQQEESKASLVGKGAFYYMVETELENLQVNDIEKEQVHNVFRLTIAQDALSSIAEGLKQRISAQFKSDNQKLLDKLEEELTEINQKFDGLNEKKSTDIFTADFLSAGISNLDDHLEFKIRYKGEIPKRGLLKRLGEGRRAMFMVLMMFSIFGGMLGFNYRNYAFMSVFFILLFIGGTIYTYFTWKKDDEFKLGKELDKARDQLHSEYMRAVTEIERCRVKQISESVSQLMRKYRQQFDNWQKGTVDKLKAELHEAKSRNKNKKQMLKTEIKRFSDLNIELTKLIEGEKNLEVALRQVDEKLGLK
ncbi:hypothetical protein FLL45_07450 [Aliikangiella marina]|uniref:Uncharacterized protein n=1 Tax=Aliikangiella marina TaxID=1712262 RepID=A0A545TC52_9GAMM|nr:hypothetical protein [Aliikangiella marina]TQV74790.1 hypothetical protein FLL45_07450 [Aliikangiella marina]